MARPIHGHTRWLVGVVALGLALTWCAGAALAGDKDLTLRRLSNRDEVMVDGVTRYNALPDVDAFKSLTRDLGLVFAPRFMSPAETLGEAGFDVGMELSLSSVDNSAAHWRALDGGSPNNFLTGQLHVRKGLPFSLEVGSTLTHLFESEMFALGTEAKLALNEGFLYLPDLAVRGTFNTVLGSSDLNLATLGFDISISKSFGVVGVLNITPYAGYNYLTVIASSRLLDVTPEDPTPPTINEESGELEFQPEFVFSTQTQSINRFFGGLRLLVGVLNITLEGAFADSVQTYSGRIGFDF
jgi:hypothetical protein